jgi:hypothetical protein
MRSATLLLTGLTIWAFNGPAFAHHSFSMFDRDKTITISGVVKEFEFANPHGWIHMMASNAFGKSLEWSFEMQPISQLGPAGWRANTLKPGDKVTIDYHPLKDSSRGGQFVAVILPDGKKLGDRKE